MHTESGLVESRKFWSYFIRKMYETDPLICPRCHGEMRIRISFIGQPEVIIHTKRNSIALELRPTQDAIKASFNWVLAA